MARTKTIYQADVLAQFLPTLDNEKLGGKNAYIMGVSYLPDNTWIYLKSGLLITDMRGTCPNCEGCRIKCYARRSTIRFEHVTYKQVANTKQLREQPEKHFADIRAYALANGIKIIRYTESGEIESLNHFQHVVELAESLPNVQVYLYTKNYAVLREFFTLRELPENLVILISVWGDIGKSEYQEFKEHRNIKCFAVNSDIKVQAMCPAYKKDKNGRTRLNSAITCGKCGLCTNKHPNVKIIGCLEH